MIVCPLKFEPIFKPKVWGGRRLASLLDKPLPPDEAVGESWECADLPSGQSVVAVGPMRGRTLSSLVTDWGADLLGRAEPTEGRFPLLIKFLDARQPLSIQVHPGPRTIAERGSREGLKHEAWYVIEAEPDAVIYRGLRSGVTPEQLAAAGPTDAVVPLLATDRPGIGRCIYCPGGTLHALGGGLVVAEVQTPSDVTYRLYDWGRRRPAADAGMHVAEALSVMEWGPLPEHVTHRSHVGGLFTTVTRLANCAAFRIEKVRFTQGMEQDIPYAELVIWIVLEGRGAVRYDGGDALPFKRGDVIVLPAALKGGRVRTDADCVWLEVTIPAPSDLADYNRPPPDELRHDATGRPEGVVQLGIERFKR
ncbi:MAG: type I phosphomannose isomerase catalytic subunit [Phycisphaerae bacterium]